MATTAHKLYNRLAFSKNPAFRLRKLYKPELSVSKCLQYTRIQPFQTSTVLPGTTKLNMPSLSPTMEQGNIVKWYKKEGDVVSPGDVLCDIETDKAVVSMDTEEEGILAKVILPDDTKNVKVGTLIALIVEEGDDWKNVEVPADVEQSSSATAAPSSSPSSTVAKPPPVPSAAAGHGSAELVGDGHLMGPSVKKLLQEYNIKSSLLSPSGPSGALLKSDVLEYIKSHNLDKQAQTAPPPATPATPSLSSQTPTPSVSPVTPSVGDNFIDIPLTNMRKTIAKRLTESKSTIPHAYASIDSNVGAIAELRKTLQADGIKISVNDFIIKASALALQRISRVNAVWENDGPRLLSNVDVSVAVATPNGLITPIVFGAPYLSVDQIGSTVKALAGKAKEGKLQPQEYQGGSFSISNLGMFGISEFTAVINPPQVAIMAVGTTRQVPSLKEGSQSRMKVTLSYDSRAISEVEATRFLEEFRNVMEHPKSMLAGTDLDSAAEAFVF